jgi:hypothetical protein
MAFLRLGPSIPCPGQASLSAQHSGRNHAHDQRGHQPWLCWVMYQHISGSDMSYSKVLTSTTADLPTILMATPIPRVTDGKRRAPMPHLHRHYLMLLQVKFQRLPADSVGAAYLLLVTGYDMEHSGKCTRTKLRLYLLFRSRNSRRVQLDERSTPGSGRTRWRRIHQMAARVGEVALLQGSVPKNKSCWYSISHRVVPLAHM